MDFENPSGRAFHTQHVRRKKSKQNTVHTNRYFAVMIQCDEQYDNHINNNIHRA